MARRAAEEEQRKRTISEVRRPDPNARRRAREPEYVTVDERKRPAYGVSRRSSHVTRAPRPSDVGRPPQLPPRYPSYAVHRPPSQVEAEYITDQIMMHLYPERKIQPRW